MTNQLHYLIHDFILYVYVFYTTTLLSPGKKAGSLPYYKINSRWIKDKIIKTEIIKVQKENVSEHVKEYLE